MALEWVAVVGTLGGAVLGAGSTMLVETIRARRERSVRLEDTRRQAYVKYLTALTQTDNAMQALAIGRSSPLDRAEATAAFRSNHLVAAIYELELFAPKSVCDNAWLAYGRLKDIRETLITQSVTIERAGAGSPEWRAVHEPFLAALKQLRESMRGQSGGLDRAPS
ncbi:hypothetical protein [Nocardia sp. CY41]|uniref:hypothetical protein n=1 Tax=Nocardia sp. CY41 TaxID=2608686 RepID=UPI00135C10C1|nr:hypothetical protein [Nocardia sp. CY41]